ncbi:unnamed protein product [Lepeophtheirus salmonis]|uniref:(salmon louse) hypothetical protein n=1 Tax=Lepeophtheirus salmonis TaxID=72036 RepID=A0A7R8GZH7_LEPSM|nr:unnamed protein product [Lepeophtheirus salmonis]CAF2764723.1 unnamed protein product [Lepeophtheirus salmonis]
MDGGKEDPPGGKSLMDEIQALFAPPGGRDKKETKIWSKGHNHDCCDACGEGGNLICCDNCPSSFHLSCHAPPLDDEDIPKGDWVCLRCHYKEVSRSGTISLAQRDQMLLKQEEEFSKKNARPARLAAKKASEAVTSKSKLQLKSWKVTSRGVPSLACDYCSSAYHLDCLDPPLCEIPKDTWMCPTHVEHFIDSNLLKSTSFSQRIKLWNKYARAPVDTDSIRVDFFRKINSGKRGSNRLIRSRQKVPMSNRVCVPDIVKAQYKLPGPGFPRERDVPWGLTRDGESDANECWSTN